MHGIIKKIKNIGWTRYDIFVIENGQEEKLGDEKDWEWIKRKYEVLAEFKLISETESELKFLSIQELMNEVVNGEEIESVPIKTTLIIRKKLAP